MATDVPMAQLLRTAERVKPPKARRAAEKIDYGTIEHAGRPHRGRVTEEEARLVRERLDEVNKRLADAGIRQVDPGRPGARRPLRLPHRRLRPARRARAPVARARTRCQAPFRVISASAASNVDSSASFRSPRPLSTPSPPSSSSRASRMCSVPM